MELLWLIQAECSFPNIQITWELGPRSPFVPLALSEVSGFLQHFSVYMTAQTRACEGSWKLRLPW